jgi:opacity protein-like surface antigen
MKLNFKPFLLLTSALTLAITSADEVYFDTISTKKASREHGAYFGAFGGGSSNQSATFRGKKEDLGITDQDGWFLGAEFGYTVGTPLPVDVFAEIEFTYLNSPLDAEGDVSIFKSDLRSLNLMMNFGVQLNLDDKRDKVGDFWANFRPYAGVGFGGAVVRQNNIFYEKDGRTVNSGDDSEFSWAYQVFAGVEYALSDIWSIYGEYKHLGYADIGGGEIADPEFDLWALGVKIKY